MTEKDNDISEIASDTKGTESLSYDDYNKTDVNLNDDTESGGEQTVYNADITTDLEQRISAYEQQEEASVMQEISSRSAAVSPSDLEAADKNKTEVREKGFYENPYNANKGQYQNEAVCGEVQYIPYHEGIPLPEGAVPQLINGMWYYPVPVIKKKKGSVAVKVFMSAMVLLTIVLTIILILWNMGLKDGFGNKNSNIFTYEFATESYVEKPTSAENIGKYADPDGPEINLTDNDTQAGSTEKAYEKLSVSVVSVSVYDKDENPVENSPQSEGTGIIISSDGYIVTNSHVINDDSESNVYVTTKDGEELSAVVVGCDVRTDVAVLKANDAENMTPAVFADSSKLKVGQDVVAIGSPGGSSYSSSLTRGIVSALDRNLDGTAVTYIQTDAAINPGNSGGPLANLNGQVVGINTIKIVDTQYEGMGFAIPSVKVKEIADSIIKNGYVKNRPQLGIISKEISVSMAKATDTVAGIYVQQIQDNSPLKNTRLKEGDIITKVDDIEVTSFYKLFTVLDSRNIGDKVKVSVCRISKEDKSKKENFELQVTLIGD